MLNLFSTSTQKERIDEALESFLCQNGYEQRFGYEFARLGFEYLAVAVALYVYYLERTVSFVNSRILVGILCILYFSVQGIAWLWRRYVEKNAVFIGVETATNRQVFVSTSNPKNTPLYKVHVDETTLEFEFMKLVDAGGRVHADQLQPVLAALNRKTK